MRPGQRRRRLGCDTPRRGSPWRPPRTPAALGQSITACFKHTRLFDVYSDLCECLKRRLLFKLLDLCVTSSRIGLGPWRRCLFDCFSGESDTRCAVLQYRILLVRRSNWANESFRGYPPFRSGTTYNPLEKRIGFLPASSDRLRAGTRRMYLSSYGRAMICINIVAQVAGQTSKLCLVIASRLDDAATMCECMHVIPIGM